MRKIKYSLIIFSPEMIKVNHERVFYLYVHYLTYYLWNLSQFLIGGKLTLIVVKRRLHLRINKCIIAKFWFRVSWTFALHLYIFKRINIDIKWFYFVIKVLKDFYSIYHIYILCLAIRLLNDWVVEPTYTSPLIWLRIQYILPFW